MRSALKKIFWPLLLILVIGTIYLFTLLPGLGNFGDITKFQFVGKVLGTPHATGYPNYIILNYLFTSIFPAGTLAFKANLLSAIFSTFTSLFLFFTLKRLDTSNTIAFIGSLTFALTLTFWSQSTIAEVYALNLLFISATSYFFISWNKTQNEQHFYAGCLIYALSFGNHLMVITLLPAIIYITWKTNKKVFISPKKVLIISCFIIIGALQYLYPFWRYYASETSYLEMQTPNLQTLWWYISGAQFKSQFFAFSLKEILTIQIPHFLKLIIQELHIIIPFTILAIFKSRKPTISTYLLLTIAGNLFLTLNYKIFDIYNYLTPTYLALLTLAVLGIKYSSKNYQYYGLIAIVPLIFFSININKITSANFNPSETQIIQTIKSIKKNALIIPANYNSAEQIWYFTIGNNLEKEKNIYSLNPDHFDAKEIKNYLKNEKTIFLPEERKKVPPHLNVYTISTRFIAALEQQDLKITPITSQLFQITLTP